MSPDLFQSDTIQVFSDGQNIGSMKSIKSIIRHDEYNVEPIGKPGKVITGKIKALEFLVDCWPKQVIPVPATDPQQIALF